jgi:hypothetical protein
LTALSLKKECVVRFAEPSVSQRSSTIPTLGCASTRSLVSAPADRVVVARKRSCRWPQFAGIARVGEEFGAGGYVVDRVAESQMEGEDLCPWAMRRLDSRWCWC